MFSGGIPALRIEDALAAGCRHVVEIATVEGKHLVTERVRDVVGVAGEPEYWSIEVPATKTWDVVGAGLIEDAIEFEAQDGLAEIEEDEVIAEILPGISVSIDGPVGEVLEELLDLERGEGWEDFGLSLMGKIFDGKFEGKLFAEISVGSSGHELRIEVANGDGEEILTQPGAEEDAALVVDEVENLTAHQKDGDKGAAKGLAAQIGVGRGEGREACHLDVDALHATSDWEIVGLHQLNHRGKERLEYLLLLPTAGEKDLRGGSEEGEEDGPGEIFRCGGADVVKAPDGALVGCADLDGRECDGSGPGAGRGGGGASGGWMRGWQADGEIEGGGFIGATCGEMKSFRG